MKTILWIFAFFVVISLSLYLACAGDSPGEVSDLGPLSALTGLQSLDLGSTQVSELGPLSGLTGLQSLHLGSTRVSELGPLSGLTGLQSLHLGVRR